MPYSCVVCNKTQPNFAPPGEKPLRCATCKLSGDVSVYKKLCIVCSKKGRNFARPGQKAMRCAKCKLPGDVYVSLKKRCVTCRLRLPTYAPVGESAQRCSNCKVAGDINVTSKKCVKCKTKQPSWGAVGQSAQRCGDCKLISDVNPRNNKCIVCNLKTASLAPPGERLSRCSTCKLPGDVGASGTMCTLCATTHATFGAPGQSRPVRCASCKVAGDVDVVSKMCAVCGLKRPSFGLVNGARLRCAQCKLPDDVCMPMSKCACGKRAPIWGAAGSKASRCWECKISTDVDLRSARCQTDNCSTVANYGLLFSSVSHCGKHIGPNGYHKSKLRPTCAQPSCITRPCWTDQPDNYPLRCEDHKLEADKNVVERACSQCGLTDYIKDGSVCNTCCLFEVKKRQKTKELAVKALLEAASITFVHDLRPDGGCGRARPDFAIDCGTHMVIIEVDEFQHRRTNYDCRCEQVRTINLFQEYGGIPVVFIRFNPDTYTDKTGRKQKGSSAANHKRLMTLVQWSMKTAPQHPLIVRYLCYDGDGVGQIEEFVIDYEAGLAEQMEGLSLSADRIETSGKEERIEF